MAVPAKKTTQKRVRKFRVAIQEDLCKGCDLCVAFCPENCLAMTSDKLNAKGIPYAQCIRPGDCIGCQACATVCPDAAIELFEVFDGQGDDGDA